MWFRKKYKTIPSTVISTIIGYFRRRLTRAVWCLLCVSSQNGMHTLCLLDIKVKEPDFEKMARGKVSFLPPRYMSVSDPTSYLGFILSCSC